MNRIAKIGNGGDGNPVDTDPNPWRPKTARPSSGGEIRIIPERHRGSTWVAFMEGAEFPVRLVVGGQETVTDLRHAYQAYRYLEELFSDRTIMARDVAHRVARLSEVTTS